MCCVVLSLDFAGRTKGPTIEGGALDVASVSSHDVIGSCGTELGGSGSGFTGFPLGVHIGFNVVWKSSWGRRGAPLMGMGAQRRTPCTVDMCPTLLAAVAGKVGHMSSGKA